MSVEAGNIVGIGLTPSNTHPHCAQCANESIIYVAYNDRIVTYGKSCVPAHLQSEVERIKQATQDCTEQGLLALIQIHQRLKNNPFQAANPLLIHLAEEKGLIKSQHVELYLRTSRIDFNSLDEIAQELRFNINSIIISKLKIETEPNS